MNDGPDRAVGAVHAAIDVGTNSLHLVVARTSPSGGFEVLAAEKEMVRLGAGAGSGDMKALTADAMERGIDTLRRFRQVADIWDADITAVATSAVREADNGDLFVQRALEEAGVAVEVISGIEEARLIRLGAIQAVMVFDRLHLVVDIGGGSTELVVGKGPDVLEARSVKLGSVRLLDRFFPGGKVGSGAVEACRAHVRSYLNPAVRDVGRYGHEAVVGCSGTIATLAVMAHIRRTGRRPDITNALSLSRAELEELVAEVVGARTTKARSRLDGLDERRVDIIVPGAVLLEQIFREFEIDELTYSDYALREGVLLDRAGWENEPTGAAPFRLRDPRRAGVEHLAGRFDPDIDHARHATELALTLFDHTAPVHGLGEAERELLAAAGMLHNLGLAISHASHHRHSYYVIRNSDLLTGFNNHEIELIAQVARYHRKSTPRTKHEEFARLSLHDRLVVRVLAGVLRIAIGLDRTHAGVVRSLRAAVDEQKSRLVVTLDVAGGADPSLELYTAAERSPLLAEVLDLEVELVVG